MNHFLQGYRPISAGGSLGFKTAWLESKYSPSPSTLSLASLFLVPKTNFTEICVYKLIFQFSFVQPWQEYVTQKTFLGWFLALHNPSLLDSLPYSHVSCLPSLTQLSLQLCSLLLSAHALRLLLSVSYLNILNIHSDNWLNCYSDLNSTTKRGEEESAIPLTLSPTWKPLSSVRWHTCVLRALSSDLLLLQRKLPAYGKDCTRANQWEVYFRTQVLLCALGQFCF